MEGDFKQDMEGDLLSSAGQVRSRSGLVQVWFSLQPKFNSFELDSEVGRLVAFNSDFTLGTKLLNFVHKPAYLGLFQRICDYDEPQNGDEASPNRARGKLEDTKKTYIDMALNFDENSTPTFSLRNQKNFKIEMLTSRM